MEAFGNPDRTILKLPLTSSIGTDIGTNLGTGAEEGAYVRQDVIVKFCAEVRSK